MREKGFYLVLALCIVGASAAAWATAKRTITSIDKHSQNTQISISSSSSDPAVVTDAPQSNIEKPKESSSSQVSAASSSSASSKPEKAEKPTASSQSGSTPKTEPIVYTLPMASSEVIEPYSDGELVKNKTLGVWRAHNAIDLKGTAGEKVSAVCSGVITSMGTDPLWGGYIEVKNADGISARYTGVVVDKSLKKGDNVRGGQSLGTLGEIPAENDKGVHLHFSMSKDGESVDPGLYIPIKKGVK